MTTRALVVGSVAATGLFSSLAAWAQPGRSKAVRATTPTSGSAVELPPTLISGVPLSTTHLPVPASGSSIWKVSRSCMRMGIVTWCCITNEMSLHRMVSMSFSKTSKDRSL